MRGLEIDMDRLRGAVSGRGVQLAERLSIHQTTLSRKLRGGIPLTLDELNEIARFLGRDTEDFIVDFEMEAE